MIHEDASHQLRGNTKKMSPVLPLGRLLMEKTQIGLVNECAALKCVVGAFPPEVVTCDAAQLRINQGNQLFMSVLIPLSPVVEQYTDSFSRLWAHRVTPNEPSPKGIRGRYHAESS